MTVTFDGTELVSTTYTPRFVKHESVADRTLITLPLAREDGSVHIAERYGQKVVRLQGILKGSSQADLESKVDAFTELLSRPAKNLDIAWNGSTRRYVATCTRHEFDRDHYHLSVVPWTADFIVPSGEGKDTGTTQPSAANGDAVSCNPTGTAAYTIEGSKPPRPSIALGNIDAGSLVRGIEYKNTDNGDRIQITYPGSWGNDRTITIDCDAKTVEGDVADGVTKALDFNGVFPRLAIGTNNISITCGGLVNQKSADETIADIQSATIQLSNTTFWRVQSFMVPYANETFSGIRLGIKKDGTPGTLTWRIETDNAGEPSGTLADANATGTISSGDVSTSFAYVSDFSTSNFTLEPNTVYWLVLKPNATADGSNFYSLALAEQATYPRGLARYSNDSGGTWDDFSSKTDLVFAILFGGGSATVVPTHTVTYYKTFL
jgi:hypothetical protein